MNVYISCPIHIAEIRLKECIHLVKKLGHNPSYWERGTHYNKSTEVKQCDIFVMFLPQGKFKCSYRELTTGCKLEFDTAVKEKKPILIAYKSEKGVKIYTFAQYQKISLEEPITDISGVAETGNKLLMYVNSKETANPGKTVTIDSDYTIKIHPYILPKESYKVEHKSYEFNCKLEDLYPKKSFIKEKEEKTFPLITNENTVNITLKKMVYTEYDRRLLLLLRK